MAPKGNNYAFIDGQNLHMGIKKLGWDLDYQKFRVYLKEKYHVTNAYLFMGFIPANEMLYNRLVSSGFILVFKPTTLHGNKKFKGNIDADLVLKTIVEFPHYDRAVVVTSDGDFYSLVAHLRSQNKLETILSADRSHCSRLLRRSAKERIQFLDELKDRLNTKTKRGTS